MKKIDKSFLEKALALINTVLFSMDHPKSPESMNFFQADTYRFYFLMSFMIYVKKITFQISIPN